MGLLTEIFVAPREVAGRYGSREGKSPAVVARFEFGGATNLHFEILWSILAGREGQLDQHRLELLPAEAEDAEQWTFRLPTHFVDLIVGISPEKLDEISMCWGSNEEVQADPNTMRGILDALIGLGRVAKASGLDVFLWVCL